jgi:DNA-binding winged helix-turn-helix (wHTH) protein/Tol biopolymer transport system component
LQNGFRIGELHHVEPSLNSVTGPAGTTRLEPKVMQVLVCLAAQAGQVVSKERLMRTVWPDTFVGDDVLTRSISELRRVFGDDVKEPRFIQTIPKSGYRLIADLSTSAEHGLAGPRRETDKEPVPAVARATRSKRKPILISAAALLTSVAVGGLWFAATRRGPGEPPRQPTMTQLTANPPHLPVTSARISPDGNYLAYADSTGIQVRVVDTGETQRIADTRGMEVYAWSGDGTKIRTAVCERATCTGWDLSLVGGIRRRSGVIWPVVDSVIPTPDGSRLLRITGSSGELSVDPLDGSAPRHLVGLGPGGSATWSADGERVLFTRGPALSAVESISVAGGSSSIVFKAPAERRIADTGLQLRDGRLLTVLSDAENKAFGVWEILIDGSGVVPGSPRPLTQWEPGGSYIGMFSIGVRAGLRLSGASSDGKRVVMERDLRHGDIFVARFDERRGRLLDTPRRLTSDERGSFPGAWTPDGDAILFDLGQSGSQDILMQRLDAESAEPLVVGPGDQVLPRMSGEGRWVLFQEPVGAVGSRVMRVPLAGGRPEQVLATTKPAWPRCAVRGRCVLFEKDRDVWIISSLDPVRGKGERLCSIPFNIRGEDVSPDGNSVAVVVEDSGSMNRIRIYSLRGEQQKDVVVESATALGNLDWSGTGAGFFSVDHTPSGNELLFIRLDGTSHELWSHQEIPAGAIPSPDGTHLAIAGWTRQSNAWMLTDF